MTLDLFEDSTPRKIAEGAFLLKKFVRNETALASALADVAQAAPFRHWETMRGFKMSVAMTNCGNVGWISDRRGYRYNPVDPQSGKLWPVLPPAFLELAQQAAATAGYENFSPDACLINLYQAGTKLSLHQGKDENDIAAPIVSISLGISATFLFGGLDRSAPKTKIALEHGDVIVWGGPSRLAYHGILPIKPSSILLQTTVVST